MIFGGGINVGQPAGPSSTEKGAPESNEPLGEERRMEQFDIDDSEQDSLLRVRMHSNNDTDSNAHAHNFSAHRLPVHIFRPQSWSTTS